MSISLPSGVLSQTLSTAAATIATSTLSATLSLSTTSSTTSSIPITSPSSGTAPSAGDSTGKCELLGPFAIIVQAFLGGLALLSLVYKRWRERPQRPVKIWAFDVSKQVVGSILLHMANLLLSMISSGDLVQGGKKGYELNPCSFYLLNLGIDTTLGIPILILFLKVITVLASKTPFGEPPESIKSGHYGNPPKWTWWIKQSFLYFIGLIGMKLVVAFLFQILPWIVYIGDWALKWTEGNEQLQIFFVMLFFPLVMNALQYYIIDGIIKGKKSDGHEEVPQDDGGEVHREEGRSLANNAWDAEYDSEDDEAGGLKRTVDVKETKASMKDKKAREEYNPEQDGESSDASRKQEARRLREEAPHE